MLATCPTDPSHDKFVTVVHITEKWVVNRVGGFHEICEAQDQDLVAGPNPDNTWQCEICGVEAEVTDR